MIFILCKEINGLLFYQTNKIVEYRSVPMGLD